MSGLLEAPKRLWSALIDAAARGCEDIMDRLAPPGRLTVVEEPDGSFAVSDSRQSSKTMASLAPDATGALVAGGREMANAARGAQVDLVLRPARFLIRELPLPAQADDFLERILRAQIDRWTPWSAERAVFGYLVREQTADKIVVAVAAGDRKDLQPILDAFNALKPRMLNVFAAALEAPKVPLLTHGVAARRQSVLRGVLGGALIAVSLALLGVFGWTTWESARLDRDYEALQATIASNRAGLRSDDPLKDMEQRILARKINGPYVSLILDELTRALPDDTSLTDIQMTGNKLQMIGLSRDATALIALIERSPAFSDASFYAPTTRGALDAGEQFHIEATIRSANGARP